MALIQYATTADLAAWLTPQGNPTNAAVLLRSASIVVARACNRDPYTDVPATGDVTPLSDATCAQVASWVALDVDPAKLGVGGPSPVKSSAVLGGSVSYDTTAQAKALAALAESELVPEARSILLSAGLLWQPVPIGADPNDPLPRWGQPRPIPYGYDQEWADSIDLFSWDTAEWSRDGGW